jgi:hypothetical protein
VTIHPPKTGPSLAISAWTVPMAWVHSCKTSTLERLARHLCLRLTIIPIERRIPLCTLMISKIQDSSISFLKCITLQLSDLAVAIPS